jgi:hypothetical protein
MILWRSGRPCSKGYLLLKCLYLEMEGSTAKMRRAARVGYALKSIGDFADAARRLLRASTLLWLILLTLLLLLQCEHSANIHPSEALHRH